MSDLPKDGECQELTPQELKAYNLAQFAKMREIRKEVKWFVGEILHYDPDTTPEGRAQVELYLAACLKDNGTGEYLAKLVRENKMGGG